MKPGPQCSFPQSLVLLDVTDPRYMPPPNSPQTKEVFFSFQIKVFPKTTISHESANLSAGEPKRVVVGVGRVPELTAPHTAASSTLTATGSRPAPSPSRLTVTVTGSFPESQTVGVLALIEARNKPIKTKSRPREVNLRANTLVCPNHFL